MRGHTGQCRERRGKEPVPRWCPAGHTASPSSSVFGCNTRTVLRQDEASLSGAHEPLATGDRGLPAAAACRFRVVVSEWCITDEMAAV